jgi:hypothetical protein
MIRRLVILLAFCGMCVASTANAADLPQYTPKKIEKVANVKKTTKAQAEKSKAVKAKAVRSVAVPTKAVATEPKLAIAPPKKPIAEAPIVEREPQANEVNLTWVLDPLVANSDGAKLEDSASEEANLVVTEPGQMSRPAMVIELSGHVVKTANTKARLDIQIGKIHRTVSWTSDDIQAGKFKISLIENVAKGQLPGYIPVSALAFVTKDGRDGAAMISLEKVVLRLGSVQMTQIQKDPATSEVTGSISNK